jgi:hypothetical protein
MNNFEVKFFKKYIAQDQVIKWVVHVHFIRIIWRVLLILILFAFIPCFLYYVVPRVRELFPFYLLEIWLFIVYFRIVYHIFDWYNDVWIITDDWIVDLKRGLFNTDLNSIKYENIEWIEVEQNGFVDVMLKKWNIVIHKIWEEAFVMSDVMIPYWALNEIEKISKEKEVVHEVVEEKPDEKFNLIMQALSWVVESYLEKSVWKKVEEDKHKEFIEKFKDKEGTLDLR